VNRQCIIPAAIAMILASACAAAPNLDRDKADVRAVFDRYLQSVNNADPKIADDVWQHGGDTSAVVPIGRFQGWDAIRDAVYVKFLQQLFRERKLQSSNVAIQVAGNTAWVVYDWTFAGTMANGQSMTSKGWESQIYRRTDRGWVIAHLHYSSPVTPP